MGGIFTDLLVVQEAARASLTQAQCLNYTASITLDLVAAAEVKVYPHIFSTGLIHIKHLSQREKNKNLTYLANDAIVFIAAIWRSYQRASSPELWLSRELRNIIVDISMYVIVFNYQSTF